MKIDFNSLSKVFLDLTMGTLFFVFGVLVLINKYVYTVFKDESIVDDPLIFWFSILLLVYGMWRYKRAYDKMKENAKK